MEEARGSGCQRVVSFGASLCGQKGRVARGKRGLPGFMGGFAKTVQGGGVRIKLLMRCGRKRKKPIGGVFGGDQAEFEALVNSLLRFINGERASKESLLTLRGVPDGKQLG